MTGTRVVALLAIYVALTNSTHAAVVAADNLIFDPFQFSGFRDDIGFEQTVNGGFANTASAQSFVAQASGRLESIASLIRVWGGGDPLNVAIHEKTVSGPGANLGSVEFVESTFPTDYFNNPPTILDMSASAVSLVAGHEYFVVLSTATPIFGTPRYSVHVMPPTSKSFGMPYWDSRDGIAFSETSISRIRPGSYELPMLVKVVPEPTTGVLAMFGLVGAVYGAHRSRGRSPPRQNG